MPCRYNANVHRGIHYLSTQATTAFEDARRKVAALINASPEEVVFTKNATEALNLVAYSWALNNLKPGDEVRQLLHQKSGSLSGWVRCSSSYSPAFPKLLASALYALTISADAPLAS